MINYSELQQNSYGNKLPAYVGIHVLITIIIQCWKIDRYDCNLLIRNFDMEKYVTIQDLVDIDQYWTTRSSRRQRYMCGRHAKVIIVKNGNGPHLFSVCLGWYGNQNNIIKTWILVNHEQCSFGTQWRYANGKCHRDRLCWYRNYKCFLTHYYSLKRTVNRFNM